MVHGSRDVSMNHNEEGGCSICGNRVCGRGILSSRLAWASEKPKLNQAKQSYPLATMERLHSVDRNGHWITLSRLMVAAIGFGDTEANFNIYVGIKEQNDILS